MKNAITLNIQTPMNKGLGKIRSLRRTFLKRLMLWRLKLIPGTISDISSRSESCQSLERYIDNAVLNSVERPQPYNMCALLCIKSAIKVLLNREISLSQILANSNIDQRYVENGMIGNHRLMAIAQDYQLSSAIYKTSQMLLPWEEFKAQVRSSNVVPVLHRRGHYCLIAGFVEEPQILNSGSLVKHNPDQKDYWIVIADHRVKLRTAKDLGMIEMMRWSTVQDILDRWENTALIVLYK